MITKWYLKRQFNHLQAEAENGFRIPSAPALVALATMKRVIFTSTEFFYAGNPVVRQFFAVEDQTMATKERVLHVAASLAYSSTSPALHAVASAARESGQPVREVEVDQMNSKGVTARLDRSWYILGEEEAMQEEGIELGVSIRTLTQQFEREGKYTLFLAQRHPKRLLGIFACEYPIHPSAHEIVTALEKQGLELVLLSGAKTAFARWVGKQLGISLVHSELSKAEKQDIIDDLVQQQSASGIVVVNRSNFRAPLTITQATTGKGITVESLEKLPVLIDTARATIKKVRKRLFWVRL
jgi:cation transport ATPase